MEPIHIKDLDAGGTLSHSAADRGFSNKSVPPRRRAANPYAALQDGWGIFDQKGRLWSDLILATAEECVVIANASTLGLYRIQRVRRTATSYTRPGGVGGIVVEGESLW